MTVRQTERSLARTVSEGAGLVAAAGGVTKLFALVAAPVLTATLGPSPYGVMALLSTVTALAGTVALLGVDQSYTRFFFSGKLGEGSAVERFCWRYAAASTVAVSAVAAAGWWWWTGRAGLPPALAAILAVGIVLSVGNTMAMTRQRLQGRYFRIAVSIVAAGGVGAVTSILLAIFWRQDAWALLAGSAAGAALGVWVLGLPPAETILRSSGLPAAYRADILRLGAAGAVTSPMYWLMNSADRWLLGLWQGAEPLGVYSFAAGVGTIGMMVNNGLMLAWFPEITRLHEEAGEEARAQIGQLWARFSAGLLVAWLGVTAAGGDIIRLLADPRFHEGAGYVPWLAGGILFYGIATMANTGLILAKDMAPAISWWIAGAIANAGLNALLVKPLGGMGCSVAATVSFALVAAGVMRSAQARFHLPVPWGALATAAALATGAGALLSRPWAGSALVSLCVKFPVGAGFGVAVLYIVAPDWVLRLFRWKKRG